MLDQSRPPMWVIEPGAPHDQGGVLRFGQNRIALDDIAAVSAEEIRDRPVNGLLMGAVVFVVVACALAYGVFEAEMRTRFLLGTVLLASLGFVGLFELTTVKRQSLYEVRLSLRSGRTARFVSADRHDVEQLMARIGSAA